MKKLTVILPAAGKGTRLNLPYPKEILKLDKTQALIDFSFDHFKNYNRDQVEFVVVINEHKTEIIEYLSKYKDKFNISFTYQNPAEYEYTGAIKSAYHLFGEYNVVLLPDTIVKLKNDADLYTTVLNKLESKGWTFFYIKETNPLMLSTKGSLHVDNNFVKLYVDKPTDDFSRFNAYWTSFAFKKNEFNMSMAFMEKSTLKEKVDVDEIKLTPIYNSLGIEVKDYIDLGTWPELRRMLQEYM
jgi:NDP-sugar pyrophosphorylase family protein